MKTKHNFPDQLTELAHQQAWNDLAKRGRALKEATEKDGALPIAILTYDTACHSPLLTAFLTWVGSRTKQPANLLLLGPTHLETLPPLTRIIFFLPSDYLLQQTELDWLRETVLIRPRHTYAIVVGLATNPTDEHDLADVEDRMRRVFVGGQMGFSYQGGLAEANCFLYIADSAGVKWMRSRQTITDEVLGSWLTKGPFPVEALLNHELVAWLDEAAQKATATGPTDLKQEEALQLNDLIVTMNELRSKVIRRLSEAQTDVQRELTTSLRTAEQTARLKWAKHIKENPGHSVKEASGWLQQILTWQLDDWQQQLAFNDRLDRIVREATDPIEFADWTQVNTFLADSQLPVHYPEAFTFNASNRVGISNGSPKPDELADDPSRTTVYIRQTALTGIVIAGIGVVLGLWPGVIAGGITGLGLYTRNRNAQREQILEAGLETISRFFQERIQELTRRLPNVFDPIEEHYNESFRQLRNQLEDRLTVLTAQIQTPATSPDVLQQIATLRQQLQ